MNRSERPSNITWKEAFGTILTVNKDCSYTSTAVLAGIDGVLYGSGLMLTIQTDSFIPVILAGIGLGARRLISFGLVVKQKDNLIKE